MIDHSTRRTLALAVNLFRAAGFDALANGDSEAGTRCQRAADALERAGGQWTNLGYTDDPAGTVRHALQVLSTLPDDVFASEPVLNATADGQAALRRLG